MAQAIVTGGAGFIGGHLVDALEDRGDGVVVIDDFSNSAPRRDARSSRSPIWVQDICRMTYDPERMPYGLRRGDVDVVYHLAAVGSVPRSMTDPGWTWMVNVGGTAGVLALARTLGARRVVIASSSSVYGGIAYGEDVSREHHEVWPRSPYACSKVGTELVARSFAESLDLDVVVLRLFNVIGARQRADTPYSAVVPRFARALLRGEVIHLHGGGRARRDFTRVQDVAEACVRAGAWRRPASMAPYTVINVCKGLTHSVRDVLLELQRATGRTPVEVVDEPARDGDVEFSCGDSSRMLELLNFGITSGSVRQALEEAVEYERALVTKI